MGAAGPTPTAEPGVSGICSSRLPRARSRCPADGAGWLDHWTQQIDDGGPPVGPEVSLIEDVRRAWGIAPSGSFEVGRAPFRLLAIVNRIDLARRAAEVGEVPMRFVAVPGTSGQPPAPFTVIVELTPAGSAADVAKRWKDLAAYALGTDAYNRRLASLLEDLISSALSRLAGGDRDAVRMRTAKQVSGLSMWSFREFQVERGRGPLLTTTKQTPLGSLREAPALISG